MSDTTLQVVDELYSLVNSLPRMNHETPPDLLPENGIYVFFEAGEQVQWRETTIARIVRVGTHRENDRFRRRIRQHYGNVRSLRGNKNGSVFRKHMGGALLRRDNPGDPRLRDWLTQGGPSFHEVEERVSRRLRESFKFSCFEVNGREQRLALERGLITLLAQNPIGQPSEDWLGRHANDEKIRRSHLWNTQHVDADPLTMAELEQLGTFTKGS